MIAHKQLRLTNTQHKQIKMVITLFIRTEGRNDFPTAQWGY